jgi:hypothetical protein
MRYAVKEQLAAYRRASASEGAAHTGGRPAFTCDCCGWQTPDPRRLRVDHIDPTFNQLIKGFCSSTNMQPPALDSQVPGSSQACFTDPDWQAQWRAYHRRNTRRLQIVCMRCVRQRADKGERQAAAAAAAAAQQQEVVGAWRRLPAGDR